VGEKLADSVSGDSRVVRWVTTQPEAYTSFNYGLFDTLTLKEEGVPEVKVYRSRSHRASAFGPDMRRKVGSDVIGALRLFTESYGETAYDPVYVTEIPWEHGQGMPGLIHLSWSTFQTEEPIWDAQFRGHEVAHQWWGHTVRWESYHDQWLSESLADFSGAWYVQQSKDDKSYFQILDAWRKNVLQKGSTREGGWSVGTEAGPIWLGHRLTTSKSDDFWTLVYSKGAYVVHTIRCMIRDWDTDSDARFIAMMRDFVESYRSKPATTDDLQRMIEKHIGEPMDWFFSQWIYGIHVPELEFHREIREEDGRYFVDIEVIQKKVPDDFKSIVPIRVSLADGEHLVLTVTAIGERTETTLPPFDAKPEDLEFNYYKAVLAR
jgi:hypothetical protein